MILSQRIFHPLKKALAAFAFLAVLTTGTAYGAEALVGATPATYRLILDPLHRTTLSAEVATTIKQINREMGEEFYEGETLIELDAIIVQAEYQKARAEVERARADLDAKKELFDTSSVSLLDLREAEAGLISAQSDLTVAERHLNACIITAPYDGKVVDLSFEAHELVQPGDELIEIVDDSILVAKFLVPSTALGQLAVGKTIEVFIRETQTREKASISRISSVIDPASSTVKVDAEIDNSDGHLRSGMIGKTTLAPPSEDDDGHSATTGE